MSPKFATLCCYIILTYSVSQVLCLAGGQNATQGQYPYYVSLYYKDTISHHPISFCGGAIINNQWILTSGYCSSSVESVDKILVKAGNIYYKEPSDTEQLSNVIARFDARKSDDVFGANDIALLKLETPLNFNKFVAPIELPPDGVSPTGEATITGLGSLKHIMSVYFPDILQTLTLPIITNDECLKQIDKILAQNNLIEEDIISTLLDENRFCTGPTEKNQGYCLQDTGDPVVTKQQDKYVIIGVANFGFAPDCENPGVPSIYTRVSAFKDWIQETISKH